MELDTTNESRELDCGTLWKLNAQLILIRFKDGFNLDVDDAQSVRDGMA